MKTRITVETLIGETIPTYFLDYFDEYRMEWKNYGSYKTLHQAQQERQRLVDGHIVV